MTPSPRAVPERIESRPAVADDDLGAGSSGPVMAGVGLAVLGGLAVAIAPVMPVVSESGDVESARSLAAVVVAACVLAVPILAAVAALARRVEFAGALLAAAGALAAAVVALDVQLITRPIDANRPELFRPLSAALLSPGPGAWLVLAGHVLIALAGVAGLVAVSRASLLDGYGGAADDLAVGRSVASRIGSPVSLFAAAAAVAVAVGAFAAPFVSSDSVFLVPAVVDAPGPILVGSGLLAFVAIAVTAAALASVSIAAASGALVGMGVSALAVFGGRWVAALATGDRVEPGIGAVVGGCASVVLVVIGVLLPIAGRVRRKAPAGGIAAAERKTLSDRGVQAKSGKGARNKAAAAASAAAVRKAHRWHVTAGISGIVAGLLLAAGAVLPILQVPGDVPEPGIVGVRVALLAAVILIPIGALLLFSELGAAVRPAAGIYWVAAVMAATPVLQALVLALDLPGVRPGIGALTTVLGVVVAGAFGVLLAGAGSAERDDVDTSTDRSTSTLTVAVAAIGVVASVVGLGLPLYRSDVSSAASFGDFPWGLDAWGQALFGLALIVGVVVAVRSRPARAAALFVGSALGMVVHVAGWPLAGESAGSISMGPGVVPAVIGGLAFLAAALSVMRTRE